MSPKSILLIENTTDHFIAIKSTLEAHFKNDIQVFPKSLSDNDESFNNNNYLLGKLIEGDFKGVLEAYKHINLYIIDVYLLNDSDRIGLEFAKYVASNRFDDFYIILISNTEISDQFVGSRVDKIIPFSKYDRGVRNFPNDLAKIIKNLLKLQSREAAAAPREAAAAETPVAVTEGTAQSVTPLTITPQNTQSLQYHLHEIWEYIRDNSNRLIDKFIFIGFYILLFAAMSYSLWNIVMTVWGSLIKTGVPAHLGDSGTSKLEEETQILKTAEHIFLYLLPLFIIFGFFNYYQLSTRITLLGGRKETNDNENSMKAVNMTKLMFISSIVSYVVIKVIERIFFLKGDKYTGNDLQLTIIGAVILLMLMAYYILLDKKKH
ncbi:MAG: hypothetical protein U0X40_11695 [Ferruginibacter sp.]